MYGKIFSSMFQGSLHGQWEAIVTFTAMIILADQDGELDMTPEALAALTSIPIEIIRKGITSLEAIDPESRTPDEEGRRIVRVSATRAWGWRITNYKHYRAMRTAEERREYFREHKRQQRGTLSTGVHPSSPAGTGSHRESTKSTNSRSRGSKQKQREEASATPTPVGGAAAPSGWDGSALTEEARPHFEAFARAHPRPHAFRDGVRALGPGGLHQRPGYTWAVISEALVKFASSEIPGVPGEKILLRFIDDLLVAPTMAGESEIDRALRLEQARITGAVDRDVLRGVSA